MKRFRRWVVYFFAGLLGICLLSAALSAVSNANLPTQSKVLHNISEPQKAILVEVTHLRQELGNDLWQGWGDAEIPLIVYNEGYAFMVGYPGLPPQGWVMEPRGEERGTIWEETTSDTFAGRPYYFQALVDPKKTPENFTVRVGDAWAATMQTQEYSEIAFLSEFPQELPGFIRPVIPYRLVWNFLFGSPKIYIGGLAHESFHAYQGLVAPERLADAEYSVASEDNYPWDQQASEDAWSEELDLLSSAAQAETDAEAAELARGFLEQRESRRAEAHLSEALINYERQREWLEGLAKYTELSLLRMAGATPGYQPSPEMSAVQDFKGYGDVEEYYSQQLGEVRRMTSQTDTRFYYSGFAEAVLLDRLSPGWKDRIWQDGVWLEDLLAEALE